MARRARRTANSKGPAMRALVVCCLLLAALAAPAAADRGRGAIYISSLPSNADVWLDGTFVGESPILISAVAPGHHVVSVSKAGFTVQDVGVDVGDSGEPLMESVQLVAMTSAIRQMGSLAIRSDIAGGAIYLDGGAIGRAPLASRRLAAGTHHVEVRVKGAAVARDVEVYPDTETVVVLHAASNTGTVVLAPADAYLPDDVFTLLGGKLVIRYAGHKVVGHLDQRDYAVDDLPRHYDAAPTVVGGRLYLPLALLQWLAAESKK
ncbi:PEGA domain-containing protein [bacterium]|nr:MAG: PEGA domain-containing protein [bacterium]